MKRGAIFTALLLAGCATGSLDPHRWKTVMAPAEGGAVTVKHGNRLRLPLAANPADGYEWHRSEPQILRVMSEGPADPQGLNFTPVRSGEEKISLEYRPIAGGPAQKTVSYDITVPDDSGFWSRYFRALSPL